jgi:hypothetical protein
MALELMARQCVHAFVTLSLLDVPDWWIDGAAGNA